MYYHFLSNVYHTERYTLDTCLYTGKNVITTGNHVVLFAYKQVNDQVTHTTMRMNLTLNF